MKTQTLVLSAALLGAASSALADKVTLNGGPGYGGGAFSAAIKLEAGSPFGGPVNSTVQRKTFCLESSSYFAPGTEYFVEYSNSATPGGGLPGSQDPISSATAWLFSNAVSATLSWNIGSGNVNFDIGNEIHNKAVQAAIWQLEGESNPFSLTQLQKDIRDAVVAKANSLSLLGQFYGVQVMRLWDGRSGTAGNYQYTGDHQDQLVLIPLPQAAWAGMSMMAGVVGMAYIRRRKQQV